MESLNNIYNDIKNLSGDVRDEIRTRSVMVIKDVLPEMEALKLKANVQRYIKQNPHRKALPQDNPVVYKLYWSSSQIHVRDDSRLLEALTHANSFWHASSSTEISLKENTSNHLQGQDTPHVNVYDKDLIINDKIDLRDLYDKGHIDNWYNLPCKFGISSHGQIHLIFVYQLLKF